MSARPSAAGSEPVGVERQDQGGRFRRGRSEALRQRGHRAGRGLSHGQERRPQDDQQDMEPLMGLALAHPEKPSRTTWSGYVLTYTRMNKSRSSGVGRGQVVSVV